MQVMMMMQRSLIQCNNMITDSGNESSFGSVLSTGVCLLVRLYSWDSLLLQLIGYLGGRASNRFVQSATLKELFRYNGTTCFLRLFQSAVLAEARR